MQMTGAEAIVRCLESAGVEVVVGLCGHANVSILDALVGSPIRFVSVRNEQHAGHVANAYFRLCHKPAVVLTSIGPGLGNAVTGIWEAALDSAGVVVISGNVPSYMLGREAFQELAMHADGAQADVYRPFVKRAWRVPDGSLIPHVMHRAFNLALAGRPGPVLVDVPMDYLAEARDFAIPEISRHRPTGALVRGDRGEVERAVRLLVEAERPLIHVGQGVLLAGAAGEMVALAEHLGIPVTTSMVAQGAIDGCHPLAAGCPGAVGTPPANAAAREADVVLAVGTRFSELETSSWDPRYSFRFADGARLIQVDVDPHEIGKAYPVEVGIVGDGRGVLDEMLALARASTPARPWQERPQFQLLQRRLEEWRAELDLAASADEVPIRVERLLREVRGVLPEDAVVLADAGTFRHQVGQFVPPRRPQSWFVPGGLCTMGAAAPAALGAKLACPDRPVVCLIGDGGFSANDSAMATAVEAGLAVVWVVLNNAAYDSIRTYQHLHFDHRVYGTDFRDPAGRSWSPDFVKIAEGYGVAGARVSEPRMLNEALSRAVTAGSPYVLEVVVASTRVRASGHWDVADVLAREGELKRSGAHSIPAAATPGQG